MNIGRYFKKEDGTSENIWNWKYFCFPKTDVRHSFLYFHPEAMQLLWFSLYLHAIKTEESILCCIWQETLNGSVFLFFYICFCFSLIFSLKLAFLIYLFRHYTHSKRKSLLLMRKVQNVTVVQSKGGGK